MKGDEHTRHDLDWPALAGAQDDVWRETERRVRRKHRRRLRLAVAAGGALLVAVSISLWRPASRVESSTPAAAPSAPIVSMPARQTLPDGTTVEIKTGGPVTVAFTDEVRRVILEGGEAHFQVAKSTRPFVVVANRVAVRAVGTAFSVQVQSQAVEVLVTEGLVAVDHAGGQSSVGPGLAAGPETLAMVDAGKRIVIDTSAERLSPHAPDILSATEMNSRLAWRVPKLELAGTPLTEVAGKIAEFSGIRLKLDDAALGQVRLSGVLRADNVDTLLQLLETNHGIVVVRRSEREIVLGRR
jgi:transmembrane sensor